MVEVTCSTILFTVGTFPMVFVLEETNENKIVAQMIQHGGGCIASSKGPYGICLSSPENLLLLQNEAVFSTEFIKDCCTANRILDLNQYRLVAPSSYPENFNVMKVLLRQSHWPTFAERDKNDSANADRHSDSDSTRQSLNTRRNIGSGQRIFSENEEKAILHYIVENKEIGLILGNTLWKKIAQRKVQGRTWQSLKKHFLKHVLPNITKYTFLSVTDRIEFQKHLHKTAESGDAGNSSRVVNQKHVEEHRPDKLPSVRESSDSDSGDRPRSTDDQRLRGICQCNRSTSSQAQRGNKDGRHSTKQDDLQHPERNKTRIIQRRQLVNNSSDEVDSSNEEQHRASIAQSINKGRQQSVINSSDEVNSGSEQQRRSAVVQRTNNERRKSSDNSSSDDWFAATDQERHHGNIKVVHHQTKKSRKRRREEFTMEEEYAIIAYLKKHNRFSNTGGNSVWKNMAATEVPTTKEEWEGIAEDFEKKWNVFNTIGAMDASGESSYMAVTEGTIPQEDCAKYK